MNMKFYGVEVEAGQGKIIEPNSPHLINITQAVLGGENLASDPDVILSVTVDGEKYVLGRLSKRRPNMKLDLILHKKCTLSNDREKGKGSIFFSGVEATSSELDKQGDILQ